MLTSSPVNLKQWVTLEMPFSPCPYEKCVIVRILRSCEEILVLHDYYIMQLESMKKRQVEKQVEKRVERQQ